MTPIPPWFTLALLKRSWKHKGPYISHSGMSPAQHYLRAEVCCEGTAYDVTNVSGADKAGGTREAAGVLVLLCSQNTRIQAPPRQFISSALGLSVGVNFSAGSWLRAPHSNKSWNPANENAHGETRLRLNLLQTWSLLTRAVTLRHSSLRYSGEILGIQGFLWVTLPLNRLVATLVIDIKKLISPVFWVALSEPSPLLLCPVTLLRYHQQGRAATISYSSMYFQV